MEGINSYTLLFVRILITNLMSIQPDVFMVSGANLLNYKFNAKRSSRIWYFYIYMFVLHFRVKVKKFAQNHQKHFYSRINIKSQKELN